MDNAMKMKVKITFADAILGTWSADSEIAERFIASKSPDATTIEDEIAALGADAVIERGKTIFPRNENGEPVIYDYQIKGFFKDACSMLARVQGTESSKIKAYKKIIDGLIFVDERMIPIQFDGAIESCQRPLRASTPQGERVTLANSEQIPAGATAEFTIVSLDKKYEPQITEWLDYGKLRGLGQWRNGGKGRFNWQKI